MKWLVEKMPMLFFLLCVAVILFLVTPVWASGNNKETKVETNVLHKGGKSIAVGGSDVDIAGCRFSEGGLTIQWTRQDKFCQALKLIEFGYVDAGVLAICTKTWVGDLYSDLLECQGTMVRKYAPVVVAPEDNFEDDDEDAKQVQAYLAEFESRVVQLESARQEPARVIREIIQQPFLSDEKRAKLQKVLDE